MPSEPDSSPIEKPKTPRLRWLVRLIGCLAIVSIVGGIIEMVSFGERSLVLAIAYSAGGSLGAIVPPVKYIGYRDRIVMREKRKIDSSAAWMSFPEETERKFEEEAKQEAIILTAMLSASFYVPYFILPHVRPTR